MIKRKTVILCMLLLGISVSGCGKTREVDEASSKVIQISVAPEETSPTPAPDQVASAAVTTNGNLTMVNTYLYCRHHFGCLNFPQMRYLLHPALPDTYLPLSDYHWW